MHVRIGKMDFDESARAISGPSGTALLTVRECALLACLARHADRPVSRDELLAEAWGWRNTGDIRTKTVDVHIGRLRSKLSEAGLNPGMVKTVRFEGYRLGTAEDGR